MNMKYDSSVMHQITDATKQRIADARNNLDRACNSFRYISKTDWNDEKRQELEKALEGATSSLKASFRELVDYLAYLDAKMREFENRG